MALASKVARAAVWSAVRIAGSQVTSFLVFMSLTRLLAPKEIGLMALAAAIIDLTGPWTRELEDRARACVSSKGPAIVARIIIG